MAVALATPTAVTPTRKERRERAAIGVFNIARFVLINAHRGPPKIDHWAHFGGRTLESKVSR
jgi:hypothetical protein